MKSQKIATTLIHITERLADVISQENGALKHRRPRVLSETLDEKEQLTTA